MVVLYDNELTFQTRGMSSLIERNSIRQDLRENRELSTESVVEGLRVQNCSKLRKEITDMNQNAI